MHKNKNKSLVFIAGRTSLYVLRAQRQNCSLKIVIRHRKVLAVSLFAFASFQERGQKCFVLILTLGCHTGVQLHCIHTELEKR